MILLLLDENAAEGSSKQVSVWEEVWSDATAGLSATIPWFIYSVYLSFAVFLVLPYQCTMVCNLMSEICRHALIGPRPLQQMYYGKNSAQKLKCQNNTDSPELASGYQ